MVHGSYPEPAIFNCIYEMESKMFVLGLTKYWSGARGRWCAVGDVCSLERCLP